MTQEDKQLLLKDLCARLPYGVMCHIKGDDTNTSRKLSRIEVDELDGNLLDFWTDREDYLSIQVYLSEVKPYLRPMSSMTEEECRELTEMTITSPNLETAAVLFRERHYEEEPHWRNDWAICSLPKILNWLNAHHFDYRGLIDKGLAIAVTEENNPYKE